MPPLSYSSISNFLQCPKKFEQVNLLKAVKDVGSEATRHGNLVHEQIERAIKGENVIPLQRPLDSLIETLQAIGAEVEKPVAVTKSWEPCEFTDPRAVLRGRIDALVASASRVAVIDWKTGKRRDNTLQATVYTAMVAPLYPGRPIQAVFDYLDKGRDPPILILPRDAKNHVGDILNSIWGTKNFIPRPSGLCGWCPVNTCQYWRGR